MGRKATQPRSVPQARSAPRAKRKSTDADDPLYHQVFTTLRDEIFAGRYDQAEVLPSEKKLEQRFRVSRITVRRSLEELSRAGLIERSKGRGTKVMLDRRPPIVVDVDDEITNMIATMSNLRTRIIKFAWITPSTDLADTLQLANGEKVLWITRLRKRKGKPVVHTTVHVPEHIGRKVSREDLKSTPIVDVLRRHDFRAASAEQVMSAAPCPPSLAKLLDLAPGAPIFRILRLLRDAQGQPLLFNEVAFRWDCFSYRLSLKPDQHGLNSKIAIDHADVGSNGQSMESSGAISFNRQ
jgi:GntR family transcriptional regulator